MYIGIFYVKNNFYKEIKGRASFARPFISLSFPTDCSAGMLLLVVLDKVFACHVRRLLQTHDVED